MGEQDATTRRPSTAARLVELAERTADVERSLHVIEGRLGDMSRLARLLAISLV